MTVMKSFPLIVMIFVAMTLSGCPATKAYRNFATKGSNAFHDITLEVSPSVSNIAKIENLNIERKARAGSSFVVSGDIAYNQSCNTMLMLGVSFISVEGVVLHNAQAPVRSYLANTKARFMTVAHINAIIGETKDIIDKVVITNLKCM
jgi:hypothetical protein